MCKLKILEVLLYSIFSTPFTSVVNEWALCLHCLNLTDNYCAESARIYTAPSTNKGKVVVTAVCSCNTVTNVP